MATFLVSGADIVVNPNVSSNSSIGQDGAGQITVSGGTQPFPDDYIIEFTVDPVDANGEFSGNSGFSEIKVYASVSDYENGIVTYLYDPQNPGQTADIQNSLDGIGDTYVRFNANVLTSDDSGAPNLGTLFVAPGSNIANVGSVTIDRHTDVDLNEDGTVDTSTIEDGNGLFNTGVADINSPVCFTAGSRITTELGDIPVEHLRIGDKVMTQDHGLQPVLWVGKHTWGAIALAARPSLRPVLIPKGQFGATCDTRVSQQHCLLYGSEHLMRAKHFAANAIDGISIDQNARSVTYVHFLLPQHGLVTVNGVVAETLYPGPSSMAAMGASNRRQLFRLFPGLAQAWHDRNAVAALYGPTARPVLRGSEARAELLAWPFGADVGLVG